MLYSYKTSSNQKTAPHQQQQLNTFFFSLSPSQSFHEEMETSPMPKNIILPTEKKQIAPQYLSKETNTSSFDHYYQNQKLKNQQNYPTCRMVSTVSDYRLTLTDFIDLNLLDIKTGLIINPLNGDRLTLHEAIKLELINSDVKEIANVYDSCNSKLTIKEAIRLQLIDSFKNEFIIKNYKRMSFNEARERNLILKPLTLSEAFMFNLIEPTGYVKNPLNHEYILFDKLINPSIDYGLFDLDTKHIIDPNRKHKLLSLNEAIDTNLILPKTFEINLIRDMIDTEALAAIKLWSPTLNTNSINIRINLFDAFFNIKNLNLNLLLYKPEIENVYIKINHEQQQQVHQKSKYIRKNIGLLEAINYKVIDLTKEIYYLSYPTSYLTFNDALENNLIDYELFDILHTTIGTQRNGQPIKIKDCLNNYTFYLEKCLFKNPFSNEYLHLDSFACKSLLGENIIRIIKNLITRINIKNYIISFNDITTTSTMTKTNLQQTSNNNGYMSSISNETRTLSIKNVKDPKTDSLHTISDALNSGLIDKSTLFYQNGMTGQSISLNDAYEQGLVNGTFYYNEKISNSNGYEGKIESEKLLCEDLSFQIKYIIDPDTNTKLNLDEAIRLGVFDRKKGVYINRKAGKTLNLNEAVNKGFIEVQTINSSDNKESILKIDISSLNNNNIDADNDSVLYEVNEINQTTLLPQLSDRSMFSENLQSKFLVASTPRMANDDYKNCIINHKNTFDGEYSSVFVDNTTDEFDLPDRIENIIEDDDDDEVIKTNVKIQKRHKNGGIKANIIERHCIQSIYGDQALETLVIDDVRRSVLLNIEGETHIHKNEIIIESDKNNNNNNKQNGYNNHRSLIDINSSFTNDNSFSNSIHDRIKEVYEVASDDSVNTNSKRNEVIIDDYIYENNNSLSTNIIDINSENNFKMHFTNSNGNEKFNIQEDEIHLDNSLLLKPVNSTDNNQTNGNRTVIIVDDHAITDQPVTIKKNSVKEKAELFERKFNGNGKNGCENGSPKRTQKLNNLNNNKAADVFNESNNLKARSTSSPISTLSSTSSLSSNLESGFVDFVKTSSNDNYHINSSISKFFFFFTKTDLKRKFAVATKFN